MTNTPPNICDGCGVTTGEWHAHDCKLAQGVFWGMQAMLFNQLAAATTRAEAAEKKAAERLAVLRIFSDKQTHCCICRSFLTTESTHAPDCRLVAVMKDAP